MSKIVPKHVLEDIRAANDIAEVIGSYMQLKRAGTTFKGLCPFHKEKTPSFHVNPQRQIYHCFGCDRGGDVFGFLMEYEGVDFMTATRMLAERGGIHIEIEEGNPGKRRDKDLIYKLHEKASLWFNHLLKEWPQAKVARDYLDKRGFDENIRKEFLFGYAPKHSKAILKWGAENDYSPEQLEQAGLIAKSDTLDATGSPWYGRFRDRLMIPIHDELGRCIAFTARVLHPEQRGGKYVNSPETILFQKKRVLFCFDKARRSIVDSRRAIVCEGQLDAIRCHACGITSVVASQGTALTENHARLLKRYADSVVLVLDADTAGQDASLRSAELFIAADLSVTIAALPTGEDPDSIILKQGPEVFQHLVDTAPSVIDFQADILAEREDLSTEMGLIRASEALLNTISHTQDAVRRETFIREAAIRLKLREEVLRTNLKRMLNRRRRPSRRQAPPDEQDGDSIQSAPAEETALAELLLNHPATTQLIKRFITPDMLMNPPCRTILEVALSSQDSENTNPFNELSSDDRETIRLAARLQMSERQQHLGEISPEEIAQGLILTIRRKVMERERANLRAQPGFSDSTENQHRSVELTHDINTLRQGWENAQFVLEL